MEKLNVAHVFRSKEKISILFSTLYYIINIKFFFFYFYFIICNKCFYLARYHNIERHTFYKKQYHAASASQSNIMHLMHRTIVCFPYVYLWYMFWYIIFFTSYCYGFICMSTLLKIFLPVFHSIFCVITCFSPRLCKCDNVRPTVKARYLYTLHCMCTMHRSLWTISAFILCTRRTYSYYYMR